MSETFLVLLILLISIKTVNARTSPANKAGRFNLRKGMAIQGYDPASYSEDDKPLEGKKSISVFYNGAVYFFSTLSGLPVF